MALIKCPECEKEISNKVNICPHCGYPISSEIEKGALSEDVLLQQDLKIKRKKRKALTFKIIAFVSIIFIAFASLIISNDIKQRRLIAEQQQKLKEYKSDITHLGVDLLNGIDVCSQEIMNNYEILEKHYGGAKAQKIAEYQMLIRDNELLEKEKKEIDQSIQLLSDYPSQERNSYKALLELYTIYSNLYEYQTDVKKWDAAIYLTEANTILLEYDEIKSKIEIINPEIIDAYEN